MYYTVFYKYYPYKLTHNHYISVKYWYAAKEGGEAILLGPGQEIPGNSSAPISYDQARRLADRL